MFGTLSSLVLFTNNDQKPDWQTDEHDNHIVITSTRTLASRSSDYSESSRIPLWDNQKKVGIKSNNS